MKKILTSILIGALAYACGGEEKADTDGGDMNMTMNTPTTKRLPIATRGTIQSPDSEDANFNCLAMKPVPTSTAMAADFSLEIKDFEDDFYTEGLRVQVFANNKIDLDKCEAPNCVEGMTNANGIVEMSSARAVPGSWYAYRVFAKMGTTRDNTAVDSVQFNEIAPKAGGSIDGISVSIRTLDLIPTVLGFNRAPGTSIVAGSIVDCDGKDVYGTRVRMYDVDGTEIVEGLKQSEPHFRYFDGDSFPSATQEFSHVDGLFAGANLPIPNGTSRDIRIDIEGRLVGDSEPQLLARANAAIFPDTVTIINLQPLYAQ